MSLPAETISIVAFASAARTASANGNDINTSAYLGGIITIDMTVVPGVDTVTFTFQGKDPLSGKYYTILASTAIVAVSTTVLRVYPGLPAAANLVANDILPVTSRIITTHSAGTSFTYSVSFQPVD
jgi:hypothetical protein